MSEPITRRAMLGALGAAVVTAAAQQKQPPDSFIKALECEKITLSEKQAKSLLIRKMDQAIFDNKTAKASIKKIFGYGDTIIWLASKPIHDQMKNAVDEFHETNPWDTSPPSQRTVSWAETIKRYEARLSRKLHGHYAPKFADLMKRYKEEDIPLKDKIFYQNLAEVAGYKDAKALFGYKENEAWDNVPLHKRPHIHLDIGCKVLGSTVNPYHITQDDLKAVGVVAGCEVSSPNAMAAPNSPNWRESVQASIQSDAGPNL